MPKEQWLPIEGYEDIYEISNRGRFRGLDRKDHRGRFWPGVFFQPGLATSGYLNVTLCKNGTQTTRCNHVLVAEAFLGHCPEGKELHHKNGNKLDNRLLNLEYVTKAQNTQHAYDTGLLIPARGETHYRAKLTENDVREIRRLYESGQCTQPQLSRRFNVGPGHISRIVNRKRWKHLS